MARGYVDEARAGLRDLLTRQDREIDLGRAALLIAAEEYPGLAIDRYLKKLDNFSDMTRRNVGGGRTPREFIAALNTTLFDQLGFHGNIDHYFDPRNSFLNEVIDRRTGIPITLTIVYIEVARRTGLTVHGVGMPLHFIAKYEDESDEFFIDPFHRGRLLVRTECEELLAGLSGGRIPLEPTHLAVVDKRQILSRVLSNLFRIYGQGADYNKLLSIIDRILLIEPGSLPHIRDRGLVLAELHRYPDALAELRRYLMLAPGSSDSKSVTKEIANIRRKMADLN